MKRFTLFPFFSKRSKLYRRQLTMCTELWSKKLLVLLHKRRSNWAIHPTAQIERIADVSGKSTHRSYSVPFAFEPSAVHTRIASKWPPCTLLWPSVLFPVSTDLHCFCNFMFSEPKQYMLKSWRAVPANIINAITNSHLHLANEAI
jgi:hypothetical protein